MVFYRNIAVILIAFEEDEGFLLERPFQKYLLSKKVFFWSLIKEILKCISWNYFIRKSLISAKYTIDGSAFPLHTCTTVNSIYEPLIPPYPHKKLWGQSWSEGAIGWPAERKETIIQEGAQRLGEPATQAYILPSLELRPDTAHLRDTMFNVTMFVQGSWFA